MLEEAGDEKEAKVWMMAKAKSISPLMAKRIKGFVLSGLGLIPAVFNFFLLSANRSTNVLGIRY